MTSSDPARAKRRRTLSFEHDDIPEESLRIPPRSSLWFDDGSVVIQAESTQFRVHRTMLSRHSQVFRDMFSVPQPIDQEDSIEGCPIVRLSDSAQDVTHLLSALYDQLYTTRDALPFSVAAAMLRLGSKYEFNHLREDALFRLRAEFPTTLESWDELPFRYRHIQNQDGILFDIINLALDQGLWSILPAAYFHCIHGNNEHIFKGKTRADGSRVVLPLEAQHACFLGKQKIQEQQASTTLLWLNDDEPTVTAYCTRPQICAKHRWVLSVSIFKPVATPSLSLVTWDQVSKGSLCSTCLEIAEQIHERGRHTMWNRMPENFGFPPWDELRDL